jgi:tape measure domain-containing protein
MISMGNAERMQSLALAFSQTTAAGRLMGQEVLQFVNAGFNPLQAISKLTGESMADLKRKMEEGKISVEMVGMAFDAATSKGGTFADMNERLAQTTAGPLSKLEGNIAAMQRNLGNAMKPMTDTVIDQLKRMTDQGEASARRMADLSERLGGPKTAISTPHGSLQRSLNFMNTFAGGSGVGAMSQLVNGYDSLTKAANGTKKEVDKANECIEKTQDMKKTEALAALQAGEQREIEAKRLKEESERTKQLSKQLEIEKQKKFEIEEQARAKALRDRRDSIERAKDFLNEDNPFTATIDKLSEAARLMQGGFLSRQQLNFVAGREARNLAESQTVERRDTPTAMAGSVEAYRLFLERDSDRAKEREIATRANDHLANIERELANRGLLGVAKR